MQVMNGSQIELIKIYRKYREMILSALAHTDGLATEEDVIDGIVNGQNVMIPGEKSIVIVQIVNFRGKIMMRIFIVSGDLDELKILRPKVEQVAQEFGCSGIYVDGRFGWERLGSEHGYKKMGVILRKDF